MIVACSGSAAEGDMKARVLSQAQRESLEDLLIVVEMHETKLRAALPAGWKLAIVLWIHPRRQQCDNRSVHGPRRRRRPPDQDRLQRHGRGVDPGPRGRRLERRRDVPDHDPGPFL
jgi:hypothetical protein